MSDTDTYLSCLLDEGKFAIGQALIQKKKLKPHSFIAGAEYNFTPTEDAVSVRGNVVYTGSQSLITGSILEKDTFRFSLTFPEKSGDFTIGNVILNLQSDDGSVFPFIWVVSKIPYLKTAAKPDEIGNRYVFNFIQKIINENGILALTIQAPEFASLAGYSKEVDLPSPSQMLFQQFYVHEPKFSPVPFIGARRPIDNSLWGMPLYSRLGDPFFGRLDSGRAGEYKNNTTKIYWGGKLGMSSLDFNIVYGACPLDQTPTYSIGGEPLLDNPIYTIPAIEYKKGFNINPAFIFTPNTNSNYKAGYDMKQ